MIDCLKLAWLEFLKAWLRQLNGGKKEGKTKEYLASWEHSENSDGIGVHPQVLWMKSCLSFGVFFSDLEGVCLWYVFMCICTLPCMWVHTCFLVHQRRPGTDIKCHRISLSTLDIEAWFIIWTRWSFIGLVWLVNLLHGAPVSPFLRMRLQVCSHIHPAFRWWLNI